MCLDSTRRAVARNTRKQLSHDALLTTLTTVAALLAAVDATANFNHRRLDDTGHSSMDAKSPGVQKHLGNSNSRTTALVEEVFGPSAVVEADESRRIYAISIPGIYPDDGPYPGRSSGYQPPVYRPKNHPAGQNDGVYPHFEGSQPPSPSQAFPQDYWKSGLRLIVSGPAETELPIASSAGQPAFEYPRNRPQSVLPASRFEGRRPSAHGEEFTARDFDSFTRQLDRRGNVPSHISSADEDYSSAISRPNHSGVKVRPHDDYDSGSLSNGGYNAGSNRPYANLRPEEERAFFRGDAFGGFRDYDDGTEYFGGSSSHQNDGDLREEPHSKLPSGFVLHGEPMLSKLPLPHSNRDQLQDQNRPSRPRDAPQDESVSSAVEGVERQPQIEESEAEASNSETLNREERPRYFNRPYHKLATPHNVAGLRSNEKIDSGDSPIRHSDERILPITTSVKVERKEVANTRTSDTSPLDYYDDLYEEFMQSSYNDYYDNAPSETPKSGSNRASPHQRASEENPPGKKLSTPDGRDVELVETQVSHTRRDPPSDMYTTSRTIGLPASSSSAETTGEQSTIRSAVEKGERTSERTPSSSTIPSPPSSSSVANVDLSEDHISGDDATDSFKTPKVTAIDYVTNSDTSRPLEMGTTAPSENPPSAIQGPVTFPAQHPYRSSAPTSPKISLSEILQNIGLSLPQFLVQLKIHKMDLKQFTNKLEKRSLTQTELKRAEGNLGMLLKILDETSISAEIQPTPVYQPHTSERPTFRKISHDPEPKVTTEQETTLSSLSTTVPKIRQPSTSTAEEPPPSTENLSSTTHSTTVPPKKFGFRPSTDINSHGQFVVSPNITSVNNSENETLASSPKEDKTVGGISDMEFSGEKSEVTHRPYRGIFGDWKERRDHNRGVSSRLGTTTRRPKFRPAYSYYGGETDLKDLIDKQNEENKKSSVVSDDEESSSSNKESSIILSKGESTVIGLTEGTPLGGSYDHPRYDRDPNSLNIATRSAIMAAGVLGGVALAVFITIFVFVMYRNHVGKRRLRVPFPVSISSDESVSSTPELYSTRSRIGLGGRTSSSRTDFWGTLRRKFDPYSLNSSTASYY